MAASEKVAKLTEQDDIVSYEKVKEAILRHYDITNESYQQRFRSGKRNKDKSNREFLARLTDMASK